MALMLRVHDLLYCVFSYLSLFFSVSFVSSSNETKEIEDQPVINQIKLESDLFSNIYT